MNRTSAGEMQSERSTYRVVNRVRTVDENDIVFLQATLLQTLRNLPIHRPQSTWELANNASRGGREDEQPRPEDKRRDSNSRLRELAKCRLK